MKQLSFIDSRQEIAPEPAGSGKTRRVRFFHFRYRQAGRPVPEQQAAALPVPPCGGVLLVKGGVTSERPAVAPKIHLAVCACLVFGCSHPV